MYIFAKGYMSDPDTQVPRLNYMKPFFIDQSRPHHSRDLQVEDVCCSSTFDPLSEAEYRWAAWCAESDSLENYK